MLNSYHGNQSLRRIFLFWYAGFLFSWEEFQYKQQCFGHVHGAVLPQDGHTCAPVFILVIGALIRMAVKRTTSTST